MKDVKDCSFNLDATDYELDFVLNGQYVLGNMKLNEVTTYLISMKTLISLMH